MLPFQVDTLGSVDMTCLNRFGPWSSSVYGLELWRPFKSIAMLFGNVCVQLDKPPITTQALSYI